jgi:hypothetical protein
MFWAVQTPDATEQGNWTGGTAPGDTNNNPNRIPISYREWEISKLGWLEPSGGLTIIDY